MAQMLLLALLVVAPSPSTAETQFAKISLNVNEEDFINGRAQQFHDNSDLDEAEEQVVQAKQTFAQALHDFEEAEVQHAPYSTALLEGAQELLLKYAGKSILDALDRSGAKAALETSGALRDSVAAAMEHALNPENAMNEQHLLLLDRARRALPDETGALLEKSVARKDATPCIHVLENAHGFPLADFDTPPGAMFFSREDCSNSCLNMCKMAMMQGNTRFGIEPNEMAGMGMSQREISMVGGAQQVGAKCDGPSCRCLDATETVNKVRAMMMSGMGMIDLTKNEPFEGYPSEMICMDACHDENGMVDGLGMVKFEGVCFDEAMGF